MENSLKGQPKMCIANVPTGLPVVSKCCTRRTSREREIDTLWETREARV